MNEYKEIIIGLIVGALLLAFCAFVVEASNRECARKTCPSPFVSKSMGDMGCMCVVEPK